MKGGGQLALEDASSDGIKYLGGGVRCIIRGGRGGSSFGTGGQKFHAIVDEDPACWQQGRTKHIDVRHDLVRDAGKLKVVSARIRTFSKSLDIQKFHEHAKTVFNVV